MAFPGLTLELAEGELSPDGLIAPHVGLKHRGPDEGVAEQLTVDGHQQLVAINRGETFEGFPLVRLGVGGTSREIANRVKAVKGS